MHEAGSIAGRWQRLMFYALCALFSVLVFVQALPALDNYSRARLPDLVHGEAHRPFVCRALVPLATRAIVAIAPAQVCDRVAATETLADVFGTLQWDRGHCLEYLVVVVLMYAALWGFVICLRALFDAVYAAPRLVGDICTVVALAGIPHLYWTTNYIYDFPQVFLFTLGLLLMLRRRWVAYAIVFALGCLNKETTVLLALVFAIHFWRRTRRPANFRALLTMQIAVFVAIKGVLVFVFRDNPGGTVEFHLIDHNVRLLRVFPLETAFVWSAFVLFLFYRWNEKPPFLRSAIWVLPPLLVLTGLFGYLDELRDYYEAYPVLILLLAHNIGRVWRLDLQVRPEPQLEPMRG